MSNLVCAASLIPNYEHEFATIPASAASKKARCFPNGEAGHARDPKTGSQTFYVNTLAHRFGCTDGTRDLK